jgi:hypothetical protein
MKLKSIAAAVGLAISAASQAATIVPSSTAGGSDVLLDVWEQGVAGHTDQSYTLDLGMTMTQFLSASNTSSTLATLLSTDSTWTNFLASSSSTPGDLQWSIIASGNKVPTRSALLGSVTLGEDPALGQGSGITDNNVNSGNTQVATTITNLNGSGAPNVLEQVNTVASNAYYQTNQLSNFNANAWDNGNAIGVAGVQVAEALNVPGPTSTAASISVLPGTLSFIQDPVAGSYVLNYTVAAVPEIPGLGMALLGLGAMSLVARRRKNG